MEWRRCLVAPSPYWTVPLPREPRSCWSGQSALISFRMLTAPDVSSPQAFAARVDAVIRNVLCRKRNPRSIAADVVEMRGAIAKEKGDANPWDLKYAAGGLVDIEFIAQYLQLTCASTTRELVDTSTARTLDKAARLGVLKPEDAEVLRPAVRLFHDLTQILRLCLPAAFDPKTASAGVLGLLARAVLDIVEKNR